MKISAQIKNHKNAHSVALTTNNITHTIEIPPKPDGLGSKANGGELLFLALATCYCNDIYREASKGNIEVTGVEVQVEGEFGDAGHPAKNIKYRVTLEARADKKEIEELIARTDRVAEIQNTLRKGVPVILQSRIRAMDN